MLDLIRKAQETHDLSRDELTALLSANDAETKAALFHAADTVRKTFVGDEVHLRGLVEFSNFCRNNCLYCGIRRDNKNQSRYRLSVEQIVDLAAQAKQLGYKTIVMQSGEDVWYTVDKMKVIIRAIKDMDMALTLSMGEKSYDEYKAYRDAGADRYLLRIETTDKELYHRLDPKMSWDNRLRCLLDLQKLGYEVGSGSMVGLPDQSVE